LRGDLVSRPAAGVLYEAERLVGAGVKELLVISQDTSAYGVDLKFAESKYRGRQLRAKFADLVRELGNLGAWIRLHYVYPYPHVDEIVPLMTEGRILPYLDIPFQHASPRVLKAMGRPANQEKVLDRLAAWRRICPDLAVRSTFIVGFPGETEADFVLLLDWLAEARLERVGCFKYEAVSGAKANELAHPVPEEVKEQRWHRFMQAQQKISSDILKAKIGRETEALVDGIDEASGQIVARTPWDAPEIDGNVFLPFAPNVSPGALMRVRITDAGEYDLIAEPLKTAA
jgi:ribosomal protein S12 methylthiotransferase